MHFLRRSFSLASLLAFVIAFPAPCQAPAKALARATPAQLESIQVYIKQTWTKLTRSHAQLAAAAADPKFKEDGSGQWPVYISQSEDEGAIRATLQSEMPPQSFAKISIRRLPANQVAIKQPGLLYLPHPYVVPGGRFNEMYGWDSYFIQAGLARDSEWDLAKDMADNFLYEIRNYGRILNANRTYYLSRSQPPFLTQMLLAVYQHTGDKKWLTAAVPEILSYYAFWTSAPHLTPETGLSRYFDLGAGPAPEVLSDERDANGRTHYDLIKEYYRTHQIEEYDVSQYYDRNKNELKDLFYKGDRSMRESGFDPSNRFGPFSIDIINFNPVCLNSLLYLMEKQTGEIMTILGDNIEAGKWQTRADQRRERINKLMWDEQAGLYFDYNFATRKLRHYPFLTTFYPLWAGIASTHQAALVMKNLNQFERPGGLQTSTFHSGNQWDAPFAWAPLQMISVEGLRRYGFISAADRITQEFLSLVLKDFLARGTIVEKYDVVRRATDVGSAIGFGYRTNVEGFGWTNAAFLQLYSELPDQAKAGVLRLDWPRTNVTGK